MRPHGARATDAMAATTSRSLNSMIDAAAASLGYTRLKDEQKKALRAFVIGQDVFEGKLGQSRTDVFSSQRMPVLVLVHINTTHSTKRAHDSSFVPAIVRSALTPARINSCTAICAKIHCRARAAESYYERNYCIPPEQLVVHEFTRSSFSKRVKGLVHETRYYTNTFILHIVILQYYIPSELV